MSKNYSYSKIQLYNSCPKKFKFKYIDHVQVEGTSAYRDTGVIIHDILSTLPDTEDLNKSFNLSLSKFAKEYDYDDILEAVEIAKEWLDKDDRFPYEVIGAEKEIKFNIGEYSIIGYIDRLDKISDTVYRIVDYKTGNFEFKTVEKSLQFDLYTLGIFEMYEDVEAIEIVYENIRYGTSPHKYVGRAEIDEIKSRIITYIDAIEDDKTYEARIDYGCTYCEFKNMCDDFQDYLKFDGRVIDDNNELAKLFLEYRTKSKYYNDQLEELKDLLKLKIVDGFIEHDDKVISISEKGIYVRNRR